MRVLAAIGDVQNPATWSGTGYHFLQAGKRHGFLNDGWRLDPERLKPLRWTWNALEVLRAGRAGGFQYSHAFLKQLFKQAPGLSASDEIISHFPLFPPLGVCNARISFYIDATLKQLFEDYGVDRMVSPRIKADALAREHEHYAAADRVVCMSHWTAEVAIDDYCVAREKVHVIPGGANIEEDWLSDLPWSAGPSLDTVRIGFVGKDWTRKQLPFVLEVAEQIEQRGQRAEVWAAGFDKTTGPSHHLLRSIGFIDKRDRFGDFVEFMQSMHFGALFSRAEAFGISNREFIRLGVPVITHDVGGIADTVPPGAGIVFPAGSSAREIADRILGYVTSGSVYETLRLSTWQCASQVTWDASVNQFLEVWGVGRGSYGCENSKRET